MRRGVTLLAALIFLASCAATPDPTPPTPTTLPPSDPTTPSTTAPVQPLAGFARIDHAVLIGVRASTHTEQSVNVLDGSAETAWTTNEAAPQWIEFQLREPLFIKSIKVVIGQQATGIGDHEFRAGAHDNPGRMAAALEVEAGLGTGFEVFVDYEAEFVRITTTRSTGTISWAEIEIVVEG